MFNLKAVKIEADITPEVVRRLISMNGMSVYAFARAIGCSLPTAYNWVNDGTNISRDFREKIGKEFFGFE